MGSQMTDNIIIVVGIPGSGKSSALEGIEAETGAVLVSVGTEMAKKAGEPDRDMLRTDSSAKEKAEALRRQVLEDALNSEASTVVLDTHAIVKTSDGYIDGFSEDDMKLLDGTVKAIIYIHTDPAKIIERRDGDQSRKRDGESEAELDKQQIASEEFCRKMSDRLGAELYGIDGTNGSKEAVRDEMHRLIKGAAGTEKSREKLRAV